jgi:hypothetical protein
MIMNQQRETELKMKRERIRDKATRMIWVTFRKEGIHKYPAAAEDPSLKTGDMYDVSFLGFPHRHIFHFTVAIQVWHNDRDVEFIQFKRWLEQLYSGAQGVLSLDYKSCEMISDDLYEQIASRYPGRDIEITVSEDGENGATISYKTHQPYQQLAV